MELDFGWTSEAEMSMIVHPLPHQAWLATPVVEVLSKLIVVKVGASSASAKAVPDHLELSFRQSETQHPCLLSPPSSLGRMTLEYSCLSSLVLPAMSLLLLLF